MEIETIKKETIKIMSISKSDFVITVDDFDKPIIRINEKFLKANGIGDAQEKAFLQGMINLFVTKFPRNGKLKVEL